MQNVYKLIKSDILGHINNLYIIIETNLIEPIMITCEIHLKKM